MVKNGSLEQLAAEVGQGHLVELKVDPDAYTHDLKDDPSWVNPPSLTLVITGVARDPITGAIQGFYVNSKDGWGTRTGAFVSVQTMQKAWITSYQFVKHSAESTVTDSVYH